MIIYTLIIGKPPFETSDVKTTYKRIRMNAYSFPENVPISDAARDLITKILNNDPTKRPSIDEILNHEFVNHGGQVPRILPASTLACPPSSMYVRQFLPPSQKSGTGALPNQFNGGPPATAPIKPNDLLSSRGGNVGDQKIDSNRMTTQLQGQQQ